MLPKNLVIPAQAGIQFYGCGWIPACAGMTKGFQTSLHGKPNRNTGENGVTSFPLPHPLVLSLSKDARHDSGYATSALGKCQRVAFDRLRPDGVGCSPSPGARMVLPRRPAAFRRKARADA